MADSLAISVRRDAPAIRVGDVLSQSLNLFARHWALFIGLALVAFAPEFIYGLLAPDPTRGWALVGSILQIFCSSLTDAAIIYGVVQHLRGRKFSFVGSLQIGFGRLGAVMGVALAVGVCAGLAAILLVIPGIIVWCIYAVAIPVCVVERRGVSASLKRSSFLTRGNRWRIFGALAVVLTAIIAIVVVGALLAALAGGERLGDIAMMPVEAIAGALKAVAIGVLYYQLRVLKDGVDIEAIATVFD